MKRKIQRQPRVAWSQPPRIGATAGAMPKTMPMNDMVRWAWAPVKRSPTMARPTTWPAPAEIPCKNRKAMNQPKLGAQAAPSELNR